MSSKFVTPADLPEFGIQLSRSTLWRLEKAGIFPRRQFYSPRKYYWRADEIRAYLEQRRAAARPTVPPKDALTRALDSRNPIDQFEAAHVAEPA